MENEPNKQPLRGNTARTGSVWDDEAIDTRMTNKHFAVYLNDQYVGDKSMIKNQGEDIMKLDEFLRESGMNGYTMTNQGDTIKIRIENREKEDSLRSQIAQYLDLH